MQVEAADWVKSKRLLIDGIHLTGRFKSGAYSRPRVSPSLSLSHSDRWLDLVTVANLNLGVAEILYLLFWYISVQVSRGE